MAETSLEPWKIDAPADAVEASMGMAQFDVVGPGKYNTNEYLGPTVAASSIGSKAVDLALAQPTWRHTDRKPPIVSV